MCLLPRERSYTKRFLNTFKIKMLSYCSVCSREHDHKCPHMFFCQWTWERAECAWYSSVVSFFFKCLGHTQWYSGLASGSALRYYAWWGWGTIGGARDWTCIVYVQGEHPTCCIIVLAYVLYFFGVISDNAWGLGIASLGNTAGYIYTQKSLLGVLRSLGLPVFKPWSAVCKKHSHCTFSGFMTCLDHCPDRTSIT